MDDPELVRQKRLARLAAISTPTPTTTSTVSSPKPEPAPKRIIKETIPERKVIQKQEIKTLPKVENDHMDVDVPQRTPKKPLEIFLSQSDEEWVHLTVLDTLQVTLTENDSSGRVYLQKVIRDFTRENIPLVITPEHFEKAVYLRLSMDENKNPEWEATFDYLVNCWLRLDKIINTIRMWSTDSEAMKVIEKRTQIAIDLQKIFLNYAGLLINQDCVDLFPLNHTYYAGYWGYQLAAVPNPEAIYPRVFVQAFIDRYRDDGLIKYFTNTIKALMTVVRTKRAWNDYQGPFRALEYLLSFKTLAELTYQLFNWSPKYANAPSIEVMSFLGPFFSRVTTFPDADQELTKRYFPPSEMAGEAVFSNLFCGSRGVVDTDVAKRNIRESSKWARDKLYKIVMAIIRTGGEGKDSVLDYMAKVIRLNLKRNQTQMQRNEVSSDGFMYNWTLVCQQLCEPFLDLKFSKINAIDLEYFLKTNRVDITELTRLWADLDTSKEVLQKYKDANPQPAPTNFISDIFFLTLTMQHYGYMSSIRYYNKFVKELEEMQRNGQRHVANRESGLWLQLDEATRQANEQGLNRLQKELDHLIGYKLGMEVGLADEDVITQTLKFFNLTMTWLLKAAVGDTNPATPWAQIMQGHNTNQFSFFPINNTSLTFQTLPEFIVEDLCDFYIFALQQDPRIIGAFSRDEIMTFSLVFLYNDSFIKNPYLKARLVDILYMFTLAGQRESLALDQPLMTHPLAKQHLVQVLVKYYVDVEQTGMSSQFYDKFNTRFNISKIFSVILRDYNHKAQLNELALQYPDLFIRFAALVSNDTTYLLDEALGKLKEIASIERAMLHDRSENNEDRNAERERTIAAHERHTSSYMALAKETLQFLRNITLFPNVRAAFTAPEVVLRFTAMLNFNIIRLAGPKCAELKVQHPQKYFFDPKKIISAVVDVYVNFGPNSREFLEGMSKDGRSFSKQVFTKAAGIIGQFHLRDQPTIQKFLAMTNLVAEIALQEQQEEDDLGDIPDDFMDPVMCTLMLDPVKLPSGVIMDASTVRTHLLSDPHDPFSRRPMTFEDCVPVPELKQKIHEWKEERQAAKRNGES